MRKFSWAIITTLSVFLLTACGQLTKIDLTQKEINDFLTKKVHFEREFDLSGIASSQIKLNNIYVNIAQSDDNKIEVVGDFSVIMNAFLRKQEANVELTLKTLPEYDNKSGSIFFKDLTVENYKVKPEKIEKIIAPVIPYINGALSAYFNQQPAYTLDSSKSNIQALAKKVTKKISLSPKKLTIHFAE